MVFDGSFYFFFFNGIMKTSISGKFLQNNNATQLVVWNKIFKVLLLWLPWQPEVFMEHIYLKEFERGPPK